MDEFNEVDEYNEVKSDERICLDLRASSGYTNEAKKLERNDWKERKSAVTKKLTSLVRLRVWAYSIGEYLYILSKNGHRTYANNHVDEDLLKWKEDLNLLKKEFGI